MNINKLLIPVLLLGGMLMATSCNSYLEEKPEALVSPSNIENSENGVKMWVNGVYSNWLDDMFRWSEFPRVLELDNDYISGPGWFFGHLGAGDFQGESALSKMWKGPYNLINDANVAIRSIENMTGIDEAYKNNALGELYFQKAFCYFLLVRAYGPIPYLATDVSNGQAFHNPRVPVSEVYDYIIDLLTKASEMMYHIDDNNFQKGHVCAGSAAGLLAKVYATMASAAMPAGTQVNVRTGKPYRYVGDKVYYEDPMTIYMSKTDVEGYENMDSKALYAKAAEWAGKVIDGDFGPYSLLPYDELWLRANNNASEFMFGIQAVDGDVTYCNHVHDFYEGYFLKGTNFINSGQYLGNTTNWYKLFDEQDYRVAKGVRHVFRYSYCQESNAAFYYPQSWKERVTGFNLDDEYVGEPDPEFSSLGYEWWYNIQSYECLAFTTKYEDVSNPESEYTDAQWPFLRLADVILIYAEAQNELGKAQEAIAALNKVRERSNAKLMESFTNTTDLRSAILEERAKELACEGDRRWDLIRWGIYIEAMNAVESDDSGINKTREKRHLLYPIPTDEVDANQAILENNYGWN